MIEKKREKVNIQNKKRINGQTTHRYMCIVLMGHICISSCKKEREKK